MTVFRQASSPFSARKPREHHVLHVVADLPTGDGAIDLARGQILKWAQQRGGARLPPEAMEGRSFDLLSAGRNSAAVEVDLPEIHAWALRQEDPDKTVAGRIWTSEATLWRTPDRPLRFAARLIVDSAEDELDIAPAAPGYIRQLVDTLGLFNSGWPLSSRPWYIEDPDAENSFIDLLKDPARRLPVVVFSSMDWVGSQSTINLETLAKGLCGLAYVVAIPPRTSWAITESFTKRLSVYDRAVRIYMPGFDEHADPYGHRLWLGARLANFEEAAVAERQIRTSVAQFSIRAVRIGADILPFAQFRSISSKAEQHRLSRSGATEAQLLAAATDRIASLEKELKEARDLERYALDEESKTRTRAEEAESRAINATAHIQTLLQRSAPIVTAQDQTQIPPRKWPDLVDWCDKTLVGRVALTGAARRGCNKAAFKDVEQAARCLSWLATTCRSRMLEGGGSLRDEALEDGIRNSRCGGDEFRFPWQGRLIIADWHVKTGGNTRTPENCLRIYYGWDDQTQQIIVAHMPAHRQTGAT